jgi:hypothetical protein
MPQVAIQTTSAAPSSVGRDTLKTGQIFRNVLRDGKTGKKLLGHIGYNGKAVSLNLQNGDVATSANQTRRVVPVGTFSIETEFSAVADRAEASRSALSTNDLFQVKEDGGAVYANLGRLNSGDYIALNLTSMDYAVGHNASKRVTKVGSYRLKAKVASS